LIPRTDGPGGGIPAPRGGGGSLRGGGSAPVHDSAGATIGTITEVGRDSFRLRMAPSGDRWLSFDTVRDIDTDGVWLSLTFEQACGPGRGSQVDSGRRPDSN